MRFKQEISARLAFGGVAAVALGKRYGVPVVISEHIPWTAWGEEFAPVRARAAGAPHTGIAVEGYGVPHAHVHLVPVWRGGELDPCRQSPASEGALRRVREQAVYCEVHPYTVTLDSEAPGDLRITRIVSQREGRVLDLNIFYVGAGDLARRAVLGGLLGGGA